MATTPTLRARLGALVGAFAVLLGLTAVTSSALSGAAPPAGAEGEGADAQHKLLLLFDSSGSMKDLDETGTTKIDAAKHAFDELIPQLPEGGLVGLRVYGATVFRRSDPGACTDSQLTVPIGPVDRPALSRAVAGFRPYGETPISHSLEQAAKDLGTTGKRTILLVSDGEETCDPDPCATARRISGLGINLKVDVVGFRVEGKARSQLRCIADAGSGTFYETDDAETLAASLRRLSVRAFRPFRVAGHPVTGTTAASRAPVLRAGQYVDTAPARGHTTYYRVQRSIGESTLHVGVSMRPAPGTALSSIQLETSTVDGSSCGYGLGTEVSYARTNPIVTASVSSWDRFTTHEEECRDADELVLTVAQAASSGGAERPDVLAGVPVELVVVEEPPARDTRDLAPEADDRPVWKELPSGPETPVTAGASFSDAPLVGPGSYQSSLFPGEVQFLRVRLEWGQRLEAQVEAPPPDRRLACLIDHPQLLDIRAIGPTRAKAQAMLSDVAGQQQTFLSEDSPARARVSTVEVRYANRDASSNSQKNISIPGDYYVAVSLGADRDGQSYAVPVDIRVGVEGTAGAGAPAYVDDQALLVPGPDGTSRAFRPLARPGAPVQTDEPATPDAPDGRSAVPPGPLLPAMSTERATAVLALSAIVILLSVASGVRALRRRRRQAGTPVRPD
ncbi:vWA domain-containing protein [Actinopolymorpha pittospori]